MEPSREGEDEDVQGTVQRVLEAHPIRLGILFGSRARGTAGMHSDIDVAVEFEPSVSDRYQARLTLGVALTKALGTDDIDVIDLDDVKPEVGYSALEHGRVLVGESERATELAHRFEQQVSRPTQAERRERFDDILARLEELV